MPTERALTLSDDWERVTGQPGRLLVFDGRLAHFRAPVSSENSQAEPRIVVLANAWNDLPVLRRSTDDPVALVGPRDFHWFTSMRPRDAATLSDLVVRYAPQQLDALTAVSRKLYARARYKPEERALVASRVRRGKLRRCTQHDEGDFTGLPR